MKWDEHEARAEDVIDQRDGTERSSGGPDLGDVLGGVLGGRSDGSGMPQIPGGLGAALGSGKGKGGIGLLLLVGLFALVVLPKLFGGGNFLPPGMGDLSGLPGVGSGEVSSASPGDQRTTIPPELDPDAELRKFAGVLITDINNVWQEQFSQAGRSYTRTKLALYDGTTQTACGVGSSQMGPFYCPGDQIVYIDLSFFKELGAQFGTSEDFAQAYVIAHEVGHHVQNLLGISDQVHEAEQDDPDQARGAESLSVRLELQADCLAGVWAHSRRERGLSDSSKAIEIGDVEEALNAAARVGDDRIQKDATGSINPEEFTHGSSSQRQGWFERGFESGSSDQCDTFAADSI